jgi:hypothetical protein
MYVSHWQSLNYVRHFKIYNRFFPYISNSQLNTANIIILLTDSVILLSIFLATEWY